MCAPPDSDASNRGSGGIPSLPLFFLPAMDHDAHARAAARSGLYAFLARIFLEEVDAPLLQRLLAPETGALLEPFAPVFPLELDQRLQEWGEAKLLEELACEYARLFLGPGPHLGPYESLHRPDAEPKQHWGPHTVQVKRFVEHHGFRYPEDFTGMPDHLGIEFDFLGRMAAAEAEALAAGDGPRVEQARRIQETFLQEHLLVWAPDYCRKVEESAQMALYRDAARIGRELCALERT